MKTIKHSWFQPVLCLQIEAQAYKREGKAANNFSLVHSPSDSDIVNIQGSLFFDFLSMFGSA